jgi:hypothetical protein
MKLSDHERARDLILRQDVEEVGTVESIWLEAHLAECRECADFAETLQLTTQAMRNAPVLASSSLVNATKARVRTRAAELQDQQNRYLLIGISFCLGLLWSAGSTFLGWKLSGWMAERFHVTAWVIGAGFVLFWLLPAIAMAVVLVLHHRPTLGPESALWRGVRTEGDWQ